MMTRDSQRNGVATKMTAWSANNARLQAYPTAVRTFGLGVANMCARLGAALAPFFAVYLVRHNLAPLAEVSLAVACFLAAVVSLCVPAGTAASSHLVSHPYS